MSKHYKFGMIDASISAEFDAQPDDRLYKLTVRVHDIFVLANFVHTQDAEEMVNKLIGHPAWERV